MQYNYHITKEAKVMEGVPAVVGSLIVVGALTCCALLHFVRDLKAAT